MMFGMSDRYPCGICDKCGRTLYAFTLNGSEIHIECECVTKERQQEEAALAERKRQQRIERMIVNSGLPPKQRQMTFDNFQPRKGATKALISCREYADSFGKDDKGLLIIGTLGSGKTHLASAILQSVMQRGYSGRFLRACDLPYIIQQTYHNSGESESDVIEPLRACKLLVLDDLGADKITEFDRAQIHNLIDYRINYLRPTIITTNLNVEEMKQVLDRRTVDRLFDPDAMKVVVMDAESYRKDE